MKITKYNMIVEWIAYSSWWFPKSQSTSWNLFQITIIDQEQHYLKHNDPKQITPELGHAWTSLIRRNQIERYFESLYIAPPISQVTEPNLNHYNVYDEVNCMG